MEQILSIQYTKIVEKLPSSVPFVGPEAQERNLKQIFKARIGANESVFGPSLKATLAMQNEIIKTWKYGDPENFDLKHALAKKHMVEPENIVVGEGIDGLLGYLVRLLIEKAEMLGHWRGNDDFFFCHWYAEDEDAIIDHLDKVGFNTLMNTLPNEMPIYMAHDKITNKTAEEMTK